MQEGFPGAPAARWSGVKLNATVHGGYKGSKSWAYSSTIDQYDKLLSTLASNAVSIETKQCVMQCAMWACPSVTLNVQGKGVLSLMDSGSMVILIQDETFKDVQMCRKSRLNPYTNVNRIFAPRNVVLCEQTDKDCWQIIYTLGVEWFNVCSFRKQY